MADVMGELSRKVNIAKSTNLALSGRTRGEVLSMKDQITLADEQMAIGRVLAKGFI